LITGFLRAYIHHFEHKYEALHTATDGFATLKDLQKEDEGDELGKLELKYTGKAYFLRNKLYIFFDKDGNIIDYALHGFCGTVEQLLEMIEHKVNEYEVKHIFKVKEALKQGKKPLKEEIVRKQLRGVNFNKIIFL
jgi:hypothetical protein